QRHVQRAGRVDPDSTGVWCALINRECSVRDNLSIRLKSQMIDDLCSDACAGIKRRIVGTIGIDAYETLPCRIGNRCEAAPENDLSVRLKCVSDNDRV